ncbi:dTMP kinase [Desulfurococcus mucosus]|uniref:Probable thymidylate kinase n=1 Tax=Desulfurococcus mucosus (strain ATCC 35584 / DSM 2162 / JCM 9187 / O7/1) TaxID=765177 RepID=E8R923_DESM0|nr:dTMP kinase [Desulfurococcus mucosus]ADV64999.1 thymidylate kinase [Desulfurococcus mucosus DSM 2162]
MHGKGYFIVLEGLDGAGKTTVAHRLVEELESRGFPAIYTYEPTDSEIVKAVKSIYSDLRDAYIDALAFALDRLIHVKSLVKPFIEKGVTVVSDRYFYSSVAYQSASGAPFDWILEVNKYALKPDVAIYLDVDPEEGLSRKTTSTSRFPEYEKKEFLHRVREAYVRMVEIGLLTRVDASRPLGEVYAEVWSIVQGVIGRGHAPRG